MRQVFAAGYSTSEYKLIFLMTICMSSEQCIKLVT